MNLGNKQLPKQIKSVKNKLFSLSNEEDVLLMGGYKGLLHTIVLSTAQKGEAVRSGVCLDPEKNLPHGLVRIKSKIC